MKGHADRLRSVSLAVSPSTGRLVVPVASGSDDSTVRLWDAESGAALGTPLVGHGKPVTSVSLAVSSLTGRLVVASGSSDNTVRLWDADTGSALGEPLAGHGGAVQSVSLGVSPSTGRLVVASGGDDATVRLWDAETTDSSGDISPTTVCKPTSTLRWTSRTRAQPLDAGGLMLSRTVDCGLQPHHLKLLQHFGLP